MKEKRILLIGGCGTLGSYTSEELLLLGHHVDCLDRRDGIVSYNSNYTYIKGSADNDVLADIFRNRRYDCIVDFMEYPDDSVYPARGELLLQNTDQLVFLSSYRVYADKQHPVTESAPRIFDVTQDREVLENETYAIPKARIENWLRARSCHNWTILRPVISFSHTRLDLVTQGSRTILPSIREHRKLLLPEISRNKTAGLCWAGDTGRLIAHLCCNEKAIGETFTVSTGEKKTWEQVADLYSELTGLEYKWIDTETYLSVATRRRYMDRCILLFDRAWDRAVDNSKIMTATGLRPEDFAGIRKGLIHELQFLADRPEMACLCDDEVSRDLNERICAFLAKTDRKADLL